MAKRERINPRRQPATKADVEKALSEGREQGAHLMFACILTSIKDIHMISNDDLCSMWEHSSKLLEEIKENRIKLADLDEVLAEEYDCHWAWT